MEGGDSGQLRATANIHVCIVEPKHPGNVGSVARAMKNFGLASLWLVNPPQLKPEAYVMAVHAADILDNARVFKSVDDCLALLDYTAATTAEVTWNDRHHLRNPLTVGEFAASACDMAGEVGILFGREDHGLTNDEVGKCDAVVTIPTSREYDSMNLSHAAAIVFHELFQTSFGVPRRRHASAVEKAKLFEFFDSLIEVLDLPEHRRKHTAVSFRRVLGRAQLSKWEYYRLMGVVSKTLKRLPGTRTKKE